MIPISDILDAIKGVFRFFKKRSSPKNELSNLQELLKLQGKWEYTCILKPPYNFLDGGCCHGGTCSFEITKNEISTLLNIIGKRKWYSNYDYKNETRKKVIDLKNPRKWKSEAGVFISGKNFMYTYKIDDGLVEGISFVEINEDNKLTGLFYYVPKEEKTTLTSDVFHNVASIKPDRIYRVCGDIEFTRST